MHPDGTRHSYPTGQLVGPYETPSAQFRPPKRRRTVEVVAAGVVVLIAVGILGAFAYARSRTAAAPVAAPSTAAAVAPTPSCQYGSLSSGACLPTPAAQSTATLQEMFLDAARTDSGGKVDDDTLLTYGATVCATLDAVKGDVSKVITAGAIPKDEQILVVRDAAEYLCQQWWNATRAYKP